MLQKHLLIFLVVTLCFNFGFAQTKQTTKLTEIQKLELKREKFDPIRNPNQDLETAIAKAQKENKRIILDIGGEWCGWCLAMDFYFMKNSSLEKLRDKNFVWLKVNMSDKNENKEFLAKYPEIKAYPHLFILEKDGSLLHSQDTSELEKKFQPIVVPKNVKDKKGYIEKESSKQMLSSYNLQRFSDFLKKWSPVKK